MVKKKTIVKWIITSLWIAVGAGVAVLLVAAVNRQDQQKCTGLNITIKGVSNNFFVDKTDIINALNQYIDGSPVGQPVSFFNLKSLETDLQKDIWVKKVQLFFDNNTVLQIIVTEREPVARVFSASGNTFYIDSSITMLPLSDKFSARLPVFTNFPSDKAVLAKKDSALLRDVYHISMAIQADSFMMALVEQVDITPQRTFELVPKIGNNIIAFGDGKDIEKKLQKLRLFYQQVMTKSGWNYYSVISVQYEGQVVAKRKGAEDKSADSLRTLQLMHAIAKTAENLANDSLQMIIQDTEHNTTNFSLIQESIQRDDNQESSTAPETSSLNQPQGIPVIPLPVLTNPLPMKSATATAVKKTAPKAGIKTTAKSPVKNTAAVKPKPITKNTKPAIIKPKPVPAKTTHQKPKAVMPKQNDY
jgi:cell division protein FtsQ